MHPTPPPPGDAFVCQHCGTFVPHPAKTPVFSGAHPVHRAYTLAVHSRDIGPTCTTCAALDYLSLITHVRFSLEKGPKP